MHTTISQYSGLFGLGLLTIFGFYKALPIIAEPAMAMQEETESVVLGMGCFWGAEKRMDALPGVLEVIAGYAGGDYPEPTYIKIIESERDRSKRNHVEVVKVVFDRSKTSVEQVLKGFWENHNPTEGDRQGNDIGSNYRSAIYFSSEAQKKVALKTRDIYQNALSRAGYGAITTEISSLETFYPAEEYHQDYLIKDPSGYCGLGGTGIEFPSDMSEKQGNPLTP